MPKPNVKDIKSVLSVEEFHWTPAFEVVHLKDSNQTIRAISDYYHAADAMIEAFENNKDSDSKNKEFETAKKQCGAVLESFTHAGLRVPFYIRFRRPLETISVFFIWRKVSDLWYFAIAWQFKEWYDHLLKLWEQHQFDLYKNLEKDTRNFEGTVGQYLSQLFVDRQIELVQNEFDNMLEEDEDEFLHRKQFLIEWLKSKNIKLSSSEEDGILDWTYNRFPVDSNS